jgi:hypothetical protein
MTDVLDAVREVGAEQGYEIPSPASAIALSSRREGEYRDAWQQGQHDERSSPELTDGSDELNKRDEERNGDDRFGEPRERGWPARKETGTQTMGGEPDSSGNRDDRSNTDAIAVDSHAREA